MQLTFIVVNKRVDTKILHAHKDEGCVEGTVVDQQITRRGMYDFFLVPLASRQVIANPVYYTVLFDSSQNTAVAISPAELYTLTYKLCFM